MTIVENDLWKVELELEGGSLSPETAKALIAEIYELRGELLATEGELAALESEHYWCRKED